MGHGIPAVSPVGAHGHRGRIGAPGPARIRRGKALGGPEAQALGRSRGGFATKRHAIGLDDPTGIGFALTGGARPDGAGVAVLWPQAGTRCPPTAAVMDRAYASDAIRDPRAAQAVEAVIPATKNRKQPIPPDLPQYEWREQIERFCNRLKQFRGMATRYAQVQRTVLALVQVAATWIMLRPLINTP